MTDNLRATIRSIRAPKVELAEFDPDAARDDPIALFAAWLTSAIEAGAYQPNAMVLSTASAEAAPSARTVLLKDVDERGFWFASLSSGPKGTNLAQNPRAALTFYWPAVARQVRVTGAVTRGPREVSEQDFTARHPVARAQASAGKQSQPMPDPGTVETLIASARRKLDDEPDFAPDDWDAYVVTPNAIEFWQAAPEHEQLRVGFRAQGSGWVQERLWP